MHRLHTRLPSQLDGDHHDPCAPIGHQLTTSQQVLAPVELQPLRASEVEVDEFEFVYSMTERPSIQNDLITINYKLLKEHMTKVHQQSCCVIHLCVVHIGTQQWCLPAHPYTFAIINVHVAGIVTTHLACTLYPLYSCRYASR